MLPWLDNDLVDRLIKRHVSLRPLMEPEDVYKLLYQGVCGPEHLISDPDSFDAFLSQEYQATPPDLKLMLWENIHPAEALGRLNLQAYKAIQGPIKLLTTACFETAKINWGSKQLLIAVWQQFQAMIRTNAFDDLDLRDIQKLTTFLDKNDYPPVHHSTQYQKVYQPAYRLVARQMLPILHLNELDLPPL